METKQIPPMEQIPPIFSAPNQPEDFTDLLETIESELSLLSLTWQSDRVRAIISNLHTIANYTPPSPEAARLALSSVQLEAVLGELREPPVVRVGDPVAIDITRKTPLGNPFPMQSESQRDLVCNAFRVFLWELHKSQFMLSPRSLSETIASSYGLTVSPTYRATAEAIHERLQYLLTPEGRKFSLGCHCAPKRCHGHTLAKYVRYLLAGKK